MPRFADKKGDMMQGFLKTVLSLICFGAMVSTAWAGSMTLYTEWGNEIWCESQYYAMNTLKVEPEQLGDGPVTIRLDEDLALSETFDFTWIDRDITLDLNGKTLKSDESADWFSDELINIELQNGHAFTLQDGTVTGAKTKGAARIAAGQHVTVKNVTFENNHCDGNIGDLWEGDVGGAIRCNSNLKLVGCTFRNNSCTTHGGAVGIYSNDYQSRFVIENCTFESNTADEAGGALFLGCSGRIQNTRITGNTVTGREDGATEGQNETSSGQGGGIYLTRHGGVAYGDDSEGFWWGRFEGPTLMIDEGVEITNNTASLTKESAATANNLYLSRHWNSYNNAAVMVSGDTNAETRVGLTLSNESDVFSRTLNEEGGEWLVDDYSSWFFADSSSLHPVYDGEEGLMRLNFWAKPGESLTCKAESAEEAEAMCSFVPAEEVIKDMSAADQEAYVRMFAPVASPVEGQTNTWTVTFALTAKATETIQQTIDASPDKLAAAMNAGASEEPVKVEMDVVPGLYYTIQCGTDLSLGRNGEGRLATGRKLTLDMPSVTGSSAFFRVKASELPIPANGI